ncbi:MAG: hypothetical protein KDB21_02565 [Acidimicrobiales bacterium]|nr:hypothetical protein [Acidimicrobiales bacterium]
MTLQKLATTNAFVVIDLDDAEAATGVVRCAPKILQGGAGELARSLTYSFASFEMPRSGASAGINATDEDRSAAIAAFVEELSPRVADGSLAIDPAKGVTDDDLAPLRAVDGRSAVRWADVDGLPLRDHLAGIGPVAAAASALGGLEGKTVTVEGLGASSPALLRALAERGAAVIGVSAGASSVIDPAGLDVTAAIEAWNAHGDELAAHLGEAQPAWKLNATAADVMFVGSRMGVIDHKNAPKLEVGALVPHGPLPYTTFALLALQRAGTVVLPDFVGLAAPLLGDVADPSAAPEAVAADAVGAIERVIDEVRGHGEGPVMGACLRAEAFLRTWRDELPFGRPLAS